MKFILPYPGRENPKTDPLRKDLTNAIAPEYKEEFEETGFITGPSTMVNGPTSSDNPLLQYYIEMLPKEGSFLPMLVRVNMRDVLAGAYALGIIKTAKTLGVYDVTRTTPYGFFSVLGGFFSRRKKRKKSLS